MTTKPLLIRDGTIWAPEGTQINLRTPDYSVWITIKGDTDAATEHMADALLEAFSAELQPQKTT